MQAGFWLMRRGKSRSAGGGRGIERGLRFPVRADAVYARPIASELHALTLTALPMLSFLKPDAKPGATWAQRLKQGLARTRELLNTDLGELFSGRTIDEQFYEELETTLLAADVGVAATAYLVDELRAAARRGDFREPAQLKAALRAALLALLSPIAAQLGVTADKPFIIMISGYH